MTIKLNAATGGGSVSLSAPNSTTSNLDVELTLPVDDGAADTFLKSDGSGTLSWASASSDSITEGNTTVECVDTGSNGHITFDTEGNEVARFDSTRRLLVGTNAARANFDNSTSTARLQVEGDTANSSALAIIGNANATFYDQPRLILAKAQGSGTGNQGVMQNPSVIGDITFQGSDGTQFVEGAKIRAQVDAGPGANDMPTALQFFTTANGASSGTEHLRIQSGGQVLISNSSLIYPLTDNAVSLGGLANRWSQVCAVNGTIQTSDERQKTEVTNSALGTDFIKSLRPVSYKWIEGGKRHTGEYDEDSNWVYESVPGQRTHWGFIAQEVKQVIDDAGVDFGGWVLTDKDDPDSEQALRYDQFIAPLTKALQEALAKIEALETANASLEARLTALEGGAS